MIREFPGVTLHRGDCLDVMRSIEAGSVDAVVTDPPYGVRLGEKKRNQKTLESVGYSSFDDTTESLKELIDAAFPEMLRIARRIVLTPGVRNMWMWPKPDHVGAFFYPSATGCNSWGFSCWQPIFYYGKDPYGGKGSRPDSFQYTGKAEKVGHPCSKPLGKWQKLLERTTLAGETILDPFIGSGTTALAALNTGRKCIGIERDEGYFDIACRRVTEALDKTALLNPIA